MALQREKFIAGCVANAITQTKAEQLFDAIAKFAEYGFNRAHAAAYAVISYQTAYLKANYTIEYMTAVLTSDAKPSDHPWSIDLTPFGFDASAASSFVVLIDNLPSTESCENGASPAAAPVVMPMSARLWIPVRAAFGV